jgi:hypothetical protein
MRRGTKVRARCRRATVPPKQMAASWASVGDAMVPGGHRILNVCRLPVPMEICVNRHDGQIAEAAFYKPKSRKVHVLSARVQLGRFERHSLPVRRDMPCKT